MRPYVYGVDVGGESVKLGLFSTNGTLLEKWTFPTRREHGGESILPDIAASVQAHMRSAGIDPGDTEGIGLGVPGPVLEDGTVLRCVNLGWDVFNVPQRLNGLTGLRVRAGNDANVAALGEMWRGGGRGTRDLVLITLGTGIGAGAVVDGRLVTGAHGAAGEIGHMPVNENETVPCTCGKRGCLEQYASAAGLVSAAVRVLWEHPEQASVLRTAEPLTAKEIFDASAMGDPVARRLTDEVCRHLGRALAAAASVLDPELFVIGGGMSRAGLPLLEGIRKYYRSCAFHASRQTEFRLAELGNDAGIYGAARLLLEE